MKVFILMTDYQVLIIGLFVLAHK